MDELELFAALQPASGDDFAGQRERARDRLADAMSDSTARAGGRRTGWRLGSLNPSARAAFAVSGAALAVGGAVVLPTVLAPGRAGSLVTSAWAVQPRRDGTVKVTIKDASDPAGLQRALRSAGVRAIVVSHPEVPLRKVRGLLAVNLACGYPTTGKLFEPVAVQRAVVTLPGPAGGAVRPSEVIAFIHPAAMPAGSVLFIVDTFSVLQNGTRVLSVTMPAVLRSSQAPRCTPHRGQVRPPGIPSPVPSPSRPVPAPSGSPLPTPTPVPTRSSSPLPPPTPVPTRSSSPLPPPTPVPTRSSSPLPTPTPS